MHRLQEDDAVHLPEDSVGRDDIPEATDVSSPEPMTQGDLFTYYKDKQPELFDEQGNLANIEKAIDLGILTKASLVPTDSPIDNIQPHQSTLSSSASYKYIYNEPERSVDLIQERAEADTGVAGLNRKEIDEAETKAERDQALEDEAADFGMDSNEFIEKVIIPSIDKDESPYLSAFFNAADSIGMGSTAYNALEGLGNAANWTAAGFQDGVQSLAESSRGIS